MAVTVPISSKLALARQLCIAFARFHENPTDGLVADTRPQTDQRRTDLHGFHVRCFLPASSRIPKNVKAWS
jgi:hypothetical protein